MSCRRCRRSAAGRALDGSRTLRRIPEGPTSDSSYCEFVALEPGEWVVQSAGNSAVGLYVAQLARHRGWRRVSVVRRPDVIEAVREAGGDVVLVDGEGLPDRVAEATEGATISLGFDAVGGSATGRIADCLGQGATLVSYGRMSGEPCAVAADAFVFRDLTMRGFWLVDWFRQTSEQERAGLYGEIARLIAEGTLHAPIHAAYDVSEIKRRWRQPKAARGRQDPDRPASPNALTRSRLLATVRRSRRAAGCHGSTSGWLRRPRRTRWNGRRRRDRISVRWTCGTRVWNAGSSP